MPVPKQRHSRLRQRRGRARFTAQAAPTVKCQNCGAQRAPHKACPKCGMYRGRTVKVAKTPKKKAA